MMVEDPKPEIIYHDPKELTTLMDANKIIAVLNIHTLAVDLEADYNRVTWLQMREDSLVNMLTGKPYIDKDQLKRLIKILKEFDYSPYELTCYSPKDGCKPYLIFPHEHCELFFGIAPKMPTQKKYELVKCYQADKEAP